MSTGGYVYEKESATYDSSVFTTKRMWALHVFRKQIYAFLKASTRSATVNGDAESYWDFDTRYNSGAFKLDNDETNDGVAQIHTDSEWQAVSKKMAEGELAAGDIAPIFSYTTGDNWPALGCFFVGAGGEHLFLVNSSCSNANTGSYGDMYWKGVNVNTLQGSTSVLDYDRISTYYKVPAGFVVMFSPSEDFSGNNPGTAGFRPSSCTTPISLYMDYNGGTSYNTNYTCLTTDKTTPFHFGFIVKRDQMAFLLGNDSFGQNKFKIILFGNILDNLSNDGDTHKQAAIAITDCEREAQSGYVDSGPGRNPIVMYSPEYCGATRFAECANANGDCAMGTFGLGANMLSLMPAMCPTATSVSSEIPYSAMQIYLTEINPFSGAVNYMIKDGNGSKGIVSTDLLRLIPLQKVAAGFTCEDGKFFMPAVYSFGGYYTGAKPNLAFMIGWDPSNVL